jgi:polar amino acid transport system substrate-binding protein
MATIPEYSVLSSCAMRQVLYEPRTGAVRVENVPAPQLSPGGVIVRNAFSLISPGTERTKLNFGEKSLLAKARSRPDLVRQVLHTIRQEGVGPAYRKVFSRLEMPEALGYCSAGVIDAVAEGVTEFCVGDRVACAGISANHAEIVFVPTNLCVSVPNEVPLSEATFATIGAIALQGVRQADLDFGESACVIGLGVVGILVCQLLRASGCRVVAVDLDPRRVALAKSVGIHEAFLSQELDAGSEIVSLTKNRGVDAVLISAQSSSNEPILLASEVARDKGRIVVIGAIPMDLPRQSFYEKELDLRLSRSSGPGRYDELYERYGFDYPYSYVRWTERRNIEAFLHAVAQKQVLIGPLISHTMRLEQAPEAYNLVKSEPGVLSVLFEYCQEARDLRLSPPALPKTNSGVHVSMVGAGNFAQAYRLPYLRKYARSLTTIVTRQGHHAAHLKTKWMFARAGTDPREALFDQTATGVVIATRHDSHAALVSEAFEAGKYVFVEKPLAMDETELRGLWGKREEFEGRLMVGYNRRFAPAAIAAKRHLAGSGPLLMHYRVNNTVLSSNHWLSDPAQGGGRIIGELCHFVDFFCFLASAVPTTVTAEALPDRAEQFAVTIRFSDGSIGTITHAVNGDLNLGKERIEAYSNSRVAVIDDFDRVYLSSGSKRSTQKTKGKGHEQCVAAYCRWIANGSVESPVNVAELFLGALATLLVPKAIASRSTMKVSFHQLQL